MVRDVMGRYMRKCKGIAEIAVMEVAQVGVRTRTRTQAAAVSLASEADTASSGGSKRRKVRNSELNASSSPYIQLRNRSGVVIAPDSSASPAPEESLRRQSATVMEGTCSSPISEHVLASCCSSNGSSELLQESLKFVDLEEESVEVETSTYLSCRERRETTPSSELRAESDELESRASPSEADSRRRSTAEKMAMEPEIEEFFAAAEKDLQKRFSEKYNYDVVKDEPLEGRYEWVRLKP